MVEKVKSNPGYYGAIICFKLDRFSRNQSESGSYRTELLKSGCIVMSMDFRYELNATSELQLGIMELLSQYYASNSASLSVLGMVHKDQRYEAVSKLPYGYKIEDKQIVINQDESKVVKKMFDLAASGTSVTDIVTYLSENKMTNRNGKPFTYNGVRGILTNEKMIGTYTWGKNCKKPGDKKPMSYLGKIDLIKKENAFEGIIDKEKIDKVQEILAGVKNKHFYSMHTEGYILSGYIKCKECGCDLWGEAHKGGKNKKAKRYYTCRNHSTVKRKRQKDKSGNLVPFCSCKNVNANYIERLILTVICNMVNLEIKKNRDTIKEYLNNLIDDYY